MKDTLHNKKVGVFGENIAADYLIKKGYKIIGKNYYCNRGEIDIIARKGDLLIFVEVKTRLSLKFGWPEESIDLRKTRRLIKAASNYLAKNKQWKNTEFQFDFLSVIINKIKSSARIKHFKNIVDDFY